MITITRRPLYPDEIHTLMRILPHTPGLVYVDVSIWKSFTHPYVVTVNKQFAGVCQVYENGTWSKIGPIILLDHQQGRGIGKQIIARVVKDYSHKKLFLTTTNSALKHIATLYGFRRVRSFFLLPIPIAVFLIVQFFTYLRPQSIREYLRKMKDTNRGEMCFYIKSSRG